MNGLSCEVALRQLGRDEWQLWAGISEQSCQLPETGTFLHSAASVTLGSLPPLDRMQHF